MISLNGEHKTDALPGCQGALQTVVPSWGLADLDIPAVNPREHFDQNS
jgi:hypothetical protein